MNNISYVTLSRGIPWNIPRVTCIYLVYILLLTILCHDIENTVTSTIKATYTQGMMGRLGETTAFLYSDWLFFPMDGINIYTSMCLLHNYG